MKDRIELFQKINKWEQFKLDRDVAVKDYVRVKAIMFATKRTIVYA